MPPPRPAAVLVPIVLRPALTVLLTQRSHDLPSHPGRSPFPAARSTPPTRARSPAPCARRTRRSASPPACIEPLGYLDSYRTGTGFQIVPVVALVQPGFTLALDPREVAEVFEVPLQFLMDPANHRKDSREWRGRRRFYYAMPYGERYIWGATAGMLRNMHQRLFAAMIRIALELILLFLLPTVAYLGYALLMRPDRPAREVIDRRPWSGSGSAGAVLVFGTLIYYGSTTDTIKGGLNQTYTPARIKDGQIEPGHFK